jgi:drug/metabolite transporter (DMT)-like permease
MPFLGEVAALGTALLWAGGSLLFTVAARRAGALALNQTRITLAFLILATLLVLTRGFTWAPGMESRHAAALVVSGWIGLSLGDWAYFSAFVYVGPRLTTLLMTISPPLTALLAFPVLGERLGPAAVAGMALTLFGVVWVVRERTGAPIPRGHRVRGVALAALGAAAQAVGLVLSRIGMGDVVDPLPATAFRMGAATAGVWLVALSTGQVGGAARLVRDPRARWATLGATLMGPVLGVWLSLVSVRHTKAGIAATLMSLTPVLILPLVRVFHGERVSGRAVAGALLAVIGVAVIFLR